MGETGSPNDVSQASEVKGQDAGVVGFTTVRQLVLNDTNITWEGVQHLLRLFPKYVDNGIHFCSVCVLCDILVTMKFKDLRG
jgi:hypothetical protein